MCEKNSNGLYLHLRQLLQENTGEDSWFGSELIFNIWYYNLNESFLEGKKKKLLISLGCSRLF